MSDGIMSALTTPGAPGMYRAMIFASPQLAKLKKSPHPGTQDQRAL